jgi:hypothetical protein
MKKSTRPKRRHIPSTSAARTLCTHVPLAEDDDVWFVHDKSKERIPLKDLIRDPYYFVDEYTTVGAESADLAPHFIISLHDLSDEADANEILIHGISGTALITVRLASGVSLTSEPLVKKGVVFDAVPIPMGNRLYIHRHIGDDPGRVGEILTKAVTKPDDFRQDLQDSIDPSKYDITLNLPDSLEVLYEGTDDGLDDFNACNINLALIESNTGGKIIATLETVIIKAYA